MSTAPTAATIDATAVPQRSGVLVEMATTFSIAALLTVGWWALIINLPEGGIRDTFDGLYQHLTVFLLVWHLSLLTVRAMRVWRPEVKAMRVGWLLGGGELTTAAVSTEAGRAHAYEAAHGHSLITRRIILVDSHLATHGNVSELSNLLERRAAADHSRAEDAYALPRFLFWAIPILGFIGTVVGIGGAIAGLKTGDITSAEVLRDQIGHVAGSLGTAFYATQVALILSVIALLAQTMLYQSEMSLHDQVEDLLTYQLESRLTIEHQDQAAMVDAIQQHTAAIVEDAQRRDQAARAHVQALISGHEQLGQALAELTGQATAMSAGAQEMQRKMAENTATAVATAIAEASVRWSKSATSQSEQLVAAIAKTLGRATTPLEQAANQVAAAAKTLADQQSAGTAQTEQLVAALAKTLGAASAPLEQAANQVATAARALTDQQKAGSAQTEHLVAALATTLSAATAPLERAASQVAAAAKALADQQQAGVSQQTKSSGSLEQTLAGVQQALRQLPPAIQQLRQPVQVQLSLATPPASPGCVG